MGLISSVLFVFSVRIKFFKFCKYCLCVSSSSILSMTSKNIYLSIFKEITFIVLFLFWILFIVFIDLLFPSFSILVGNNVNSTFPTFSTLWVILFDDVSPTSFISLSLCFVCLCRVELLGTSSFISLVPHFLLVSVIIISLVFVFTSFIFFNSLVFVFRFLYFFYSFSISSTSPEAKENKILLNFVSFC